MCPRFDEALERFLLPFGHTTVGEVADRIAGFPRTRDSLRTSTDSRGSLDEFVKEPGFGQLFVSHTAPGITRGNHYERHVGDVLTAHVPIAPTGGIGRRIHADR